MPAITASGNEITDQTRKDVLTLPTYASGQMCDLYGRQGDSSYSIRRAATNLFRRGQCDSTTDWTLGGSGGSVAIDTTVPAPFSPQSIKLTSTTANISVNPTSATGQAIATTTSCCSSVYFLGVAGQTYSVRTRIANTDASTTDGAITSFTATGLWQLLTPASVAVAATKTGDAVRCVVVQTGTPRAESFWVAHPMLESGQAIVAPYVATSGGSTATHAAGRVQLPASLLNATQGWVAVRMRMGWSSSSRTDFPAAFTWANSGDSTNRICVLWNGSSAQWTMDSRISGVPVDVVQSATFAAGDFQTVIGTWSSSRIGVSVNGAAFTTGANTEFLTPTDTSFDVGGILTGGKFDSDVLWIAGGTGQLTDANAATINAMGNIANLAPRFPGNPSFVLEADSPQYMATNYLVASGNEINDTTRTAALSWPTTQATGQVDNFTAPDGTYFIGRAATNLFRRGQCDATTDWGPAGTVPPTSAVDATVAAPFSPQSIKYTTSGSGTGEGTNAISAAGQAAAAGTIGVGSIYFKGVANASYKARVDWKHTDLSFATGTEVAFTATGQWQLIVPPATAVTAAKTGDILEIKVYTAVTRAEVFWVAHAMLESGQNVVAPYVPTAGGATSTKPVARVQAPASLLGTTQGWVALRLRVGYSSANANSNALFVLSDGTINNRIAWFIAAGGNVFPRFRAGGSTYELGANPTISFASGDSVTFVCAWSGSTLKISTNGGAFTTGPLTSWPGFTATTLDIANQQGTNQIDSYVQWFATGTGALTDADAATLNSAVPVWLGNVNAAPTAIWYPYHGEYIPYSDRVPAAYQSKHGVKERMLIQGRNASDIAAVLAESWS